MGFLDSIKEMRNKLLYSKEIELEDVSLTLGLLTAKEEQIIDRATSEEDKEDPLESMQYLMDIKKRVLSYAIKKVGGEEIPPIVEYEEGEELIKRTKEVYLYDFLSDVPTAGVDIIFEAYSDLKDEVNDSIEGKIKVNWYLTPKERELKREKEYREREIEHIKRRRELYGVDTDSDEKINFREIKVPDKEDSETNGESESESEKESQDK